MPEMMNVNLMTGQTSIVNYTPPSPPAPPTLYQLSKATAWRRMTADEAAQVDAAMMQTDAQLRQIYFAAQYLYSGDDLWATLWGMLQDMFGDTRTAQILAPET